MNNELILQALSTYNETTHEQKFSIIDVLVLEAALTNTYTTDQHLAVKLMCSQRTIKRSINKLCDFGFITKHLAYDNTKTLELHGDALNHFCQSILPEG